MKTKLTLTIEKTVVAEAKQYAAAQHASLSRVVEEVLAERAMQAGPSFGDKWRGRLRPARRRDKRYDFLTKRHG